MAEDPLTGLRTAATNAILTRVGDLVTTLWDFSLGAVFNLIFLRKNAEKLEDEMLRLQALRDDVKNTAEEEARQPMMKVTTQVLEWITRVENLRKKVDKFQDSYESQSICKTGFCLGYDAVQLQTQVEKLIEQGNAFPPSGLVMPWRPNAFQDVPLEIPSSTLVGAEKTMLEIEGHIMDDAVRVIGICGMGGAGKTTLLKVINNKFLPEEARDMFNLSIWVTVSHAVDILVIQKSIGDRLGLSLSGRQGEPPDENLSRDQAERLSLELSKKQFILFLDDIWEKIEWEKIGIPRPDESNKHKILFTTRDESVCSRMVADKTVKVGLLNPKDSWTLFQLVGKSADVEKKKKKDDPDVREIATKLVAKCGGLPISLITVGSAMASATTTEQWRNALHSLDYCAEEVSGMDRVLASLKFSFDMLNNNTSEGVHLQSCLLYCAFYPENKDILKKEIIDYWISEGFLDPEGHMDTHIGRTRDRGHEWIRRLQNACLLEGGIQDGEQAVRLHDTIRDMLLMIGREKYVMLAGDDIPRMPQINLWKSAKGISLINNSTNRVPRFWEQNCTALTTLLLHGSFFGKTIQQDFFKCTLSLRVLDLSSTKIKSLPLPSDIASLVELRYLNLSHTPIEFLPEKLDQLSNLTYLNLEHTSELSKIPKAVSRLASLQVLKMRESKYSFCCCSELGLSDLENLHLLCELTATVKACSPIDSNTFSKCIRDLQVDFCIVHALNPKLFFDPNLLTNLELLEFLNLREAEIVVIYPVPILGCSINPGSHCLREVTWDGQLPLVKVIEKTTEPPLDVGHLLNDSCIIFTKLKRMVLGKHKF